MTRAWAWTATRQATTSSAHPDGCGTFAGRLLGAGAVAWSDKQVHTSFVPTGLKAVGEDAAYIYAHPEIAGHPRALRLHLCGVSRPKPARISALIAGEFP